MVDPTNLDDIKFSQVFNKFSLLKNKSQSIVNRFKCPNGWQRFGGSCYYLSNTISTFDIANKTCIDHYFNHSRLMQIRQPLEVYYAAHILVKENLPELLIQIDSNFLQGRNLVQKFSSKNLTEWQFDENNFRQARMKYFNRKSDEKQDEGEIIDVSIDDIRHICDNLSWNALITDTNGFLLTRYVIGDQTVCSIDNLQPETSYEHLCQYVLDFCFGNDICGWHGRCVNHLLGFKCSCYFWKDGPFCQKFSKLATQLVIGVFFILLFGILSIECCQKSQKVAMKKLEQYYTKPMLLSTPSQSSVDNNSQLTSESDEESEKNSAMRMLFVYMSMFFIFLFLCIPPTIFHLNSFSISNSEETLKNILSMVNQCKSKYLLPTNNYIFLSVSILFCFFFSFFVRRQTCCVNTCDGRPGCLSPLVLFSITNRWETAALCGIILIEVLTTLEYFLIDLSAMWQEGVLVQLFQRSLIPLVYSIRYYPLFASLQHRDTLVRSLSFAYLFGYVSYLIFRQSLCLDFLALSKRFSSLDEAKLILKLGNWTIVYGLIKNIPYFLLLSYVLVEFFIRLVHKKKAKKVESPPLTPSDGSTNHQARTFTTKNTYYFKYSSKIRKLFEKIYPWDSNFRYTTMGMCTYTIAFLLLYYLTCIFIFQTMMGTASISFYVFCIEYIFQIEMKDYSFLPEIILSGILTMIFFGWQFFKEMINYRKHTKQLKDEKFEDIPRLNEEEEKLISHKSIEYLPSVILNIIGSFFIWFHLILFFILLLSLLSVRSFNLQIDRLEFLSSILSWIGPLFVLYFLRKYLKTWLRIFISKNTNQNSPPNENSYRVLTYFTFISSCHVVVFSSIFRLIKGTLLNIRLMPRINSSYLGRTYEKFDDGYLAYVSYLYMEKKYRQTIEPIPIDNNAGSSPQIPTVSQSSNQFIEEDDQPYCDSMSETASVYEAETGPTANDDNRSLKPERYLSRETNIPTDVPDVPTSKTLQDSKPPSRIIERALVHISPQHQRNERKAMTRDVSISDEEESMLPSTSNANEDESSPPPPLPKKTSKQRQHF